MRKELKEDYQEVFRSIRGQFGADQGRPLAIWKDNHSVLKDRMATQLEGLFRRELTEEEIRYFLTEIHQEGCGFAAATTIILQKYAKQPALYEIAYGFAFYKERQRVDFVSLLLDFYYTQNNWHHLPHTSLRFKLRHPGIRAGDIRMNLYRYTKEHGLAIKGKWLSWPSRHRLIKALRSGKIITMTSYLTKMQLMAPEEVSYHHQQINFHTVMLVDFNEVTQRFVVSSWGDYYELERLPSFSTFFAY
ncbi:hypothetical protein [Vagococcus xieshaowenii]|uniref:Uncharacterized protein n=1 Tax=Vagococcus xieshaowenii TaxID=2562451 RepID=A0AAJ5JMD8_9ENTE|nr:hypothetical protein [Vagococcus xieshaowenii]QCA27962.1 hypothetical protein E4Z98_00820 [Vagococcus xieshaowenii]TFZ41270.1 hypothetical protein E4031_05305 [Vagococcus xieshaowenii]